MLELEKPSGKNRHRRDRKLRNHNNLGPSQKVKESTESEILAEIKKAQANVNDSLHLADDAIKKALSKVLEKADKILDSDH